MVEPSEAIPTWICHLAVVVAGLDADQLGALASGYRGHQPVLTPSATQLQRSLSLSTAGAVDLARNLRQALSEAAVTGEDVSVALAALARARSTGESRNEKVEVVCTGPSRLGIPVRATFPAAMEMIQAARDEILVVGYVFTEGARRLVEELARASQDRGVRVTLIGNRMREYLPTLRSMWPVNSPEPKIFSREADPDDKMVALHAKLLICDGIAALVTSANFSHHGLHENIEIGLKVQSAAVARLVDFVRAMVAMQQVRPLDWFR
jgi:phosphatidylserine/phosphatidylglycerophosphate/cardiolipin synthase-like enzyme